MVVRGKIIRNTYRDSIALMRIASGLIQRSEVARAEVLMATPANLAALELGKLMLPELLKSTANDIVIAVEAHNEQAANEAFEWAEESIRTSHPAAESGTGESISFSLSTAVQRLPNANLALISIPGMFVKREALRALDAGLNLLIFSDNVPLQDEVDIKNYARERNLLVMGPDCGTALIAGIALAFANDVRRGPIGIVAASGTGLQEVSCLVHHAGSGISHGIGTGSNDIKDAVEGISLLQGLDLLESDTSTDVIIILTKPPEEQAQRAILERVKRCAKPVVVNFLGSSPESIEQAGGIAAATLEDAALIALEQMGIPFSLDDINRTALSAAIVSLDDRQQYVRGIFAGGTFTTEAAMILIEHLNEVYTNTKLPNANLLKDPFTSVGHTCVDMGEDIFTLGKPHPMLDPTTRNQRILREAVDPETAVILLDIVLGYGVHPDPASSLVETIKTFSEGRKVVIVASVCGTDTDPQSRRKQVDILQDAGVIVMPSNAAAARAAAAIALRKPALEEVVG